MRNLFILPPGFFPQEENILLDLQTTSAHYNYQAKSRSCLFLKGSWSVGSIFCVGLYRASIKWQ